VKAPVWPGPALWLHGDPHPRNLVANDRGLAGILDFGDLAAGDPANDLAAAWWCFNPADRAHFVARIDASGAYDRDVWTRAAGWAASLASAIPPDSPMEPVARHTAAQLTNGPGPPSGPPR
jgi:aminoglycoside phosphotransferase (APT) family kinase protein